MDTTENKSNSPSVFAAGVVLGSLLMLFLCIGDTRQLQALPIKYEHCTNNRGVAAYCEVKGRFTDKVLCEDYRKRIWSDHEPDDIRTYCR